MYARTQELTAVWVLFTWHQQQEHVNQAGRQPDWLLETLISLNWPILLRRLHARGAPARPAPAPLAGASDSGGVVGSLWTSDYPNAIIIYNSPSPSYMLTQLKDISFNRHKIEAQITHPNIFAYFFPPSYKNED